MEGPRWFDVKLESSLCHVFLELFLGFWRSKIEFMTAGIFNTLRTVQYLHCQRHHHGGSCFPHSQPAGTHQGHPPSTSIGSVFS